MKTFYLSCCAALLLTACQNKASDEFGAEDEGGPVAADAPEVDPNAIPIPKPIKVPLDDRITISPEPLLSENAACVVPLRVSNGTGSPIFVSMFNFKLSGSGKDDTGNMFAQSTPSGEARTARVILIGQSCNAFDTVTIGEVLCVSGDDECPVSVEFEDSAEIKLIGPNN